MCLGLSMLEITSPLISLYYVSLLLQTKLFKITIFVLPGSTFYIIVGMMDHGTVFIIGLGNMNKKDPMMDKFSSHLCDPMW